MENIDLEQTYLDKTLKVVDRDISKLEKTCESGINEVRKLSKYHWETKSEMDDIEIANTMNDVNHTATITNSVLSKLRKLRKAAESPFFGKIKIDFDGEQEEFYIGITSIMDNNDVVVNDWRSPISNLFYNSRIGNTSYVAPAGIIYCNLLQREQIKIKDRKVSRVVDTDIHLTDDELQKVLSKNSDGKMKNIVTTIQQEQNEIIRDLKDSKIIVQGCAGSGKTSVALHRLSYLLYTDKKASSENMLIFSPSDIFSSYISNVLPDLGEDNVLQTTFSDFANTFVKKFDKIETFSDFLSKYYDGKNTDEQNKLNKFKFSNEYKEALDLFIKRYTNSYRFKDDYSFSGLTIPCNYLNKILDNSEECSLQEKIDLVFYSINSLINKKMIVKKETLRKSIINSLIGSSVDMKSIYNKFLKSQEFIDAYGKAGNCINKIILEYPDLIGMLYLNFELMGYPKNNIIHHLVIDEVQDYTPLQIEMISKMFSGATITALGDAKQTINPYHKYNSLEDIKKELGITSRYIELNKAYRSSKEIMNYVKEIIDDNKIEPVRIKSDNDVLVKEVDKKDIFSSLVEDIINLKNKGFNKICIITKSNKEATAIFEGLKDSVDEISVLSNDMEYQFNTLIAPAYNAKGLEFDAVICYNDLENSYSEDEKYLYYVACTRAQHDLVVYNEPKELRKRR